MGKLLENEILRASLNKVAKRLVYAYRNAFVHKSKLPIIPETTPSETNQSVFYQSVFDYVDGKLVLHTLDMKFLLEAFRNSIRKFFETAYP